MSSYSIVKDVKKLVSCNLRWRYHVNRQSSTSTEKKKLLLRNVFKDNPTIKYWLLGGLGISLGITYYIYKNERKKSVILNILPPLPSHYCVSRDEDVKQLEELLNSSKVTKPMKEVQISGPSGSGKTQLARMLAEKLTEDRGESFRFKLWPKDEVTMYLNAVNKQSLLLGLKQIAAKLGCTKDEIKSEQTDLDLQLNVVSQIVQEKLKQKSSWILIVDHYEKPLAKWLPDSKWGNGYVIHTTKMENIDALENDVKRPNYHLKRLSSKCAKQLFSGVVNEDMKCKTIEEIPEKFLELLQHNPMALVYAAVLFKNKILQNKQYSLDNLFSEIESTFSCLSQTNPGTSKLLNIQTSCITLVTKLMIDLSPNLAHVFDFLGSCNASHPIPIGIILCHLKTPEYHIHVEQDDILKTDQPIQDTSLKVIPELETEQNLWSFHGIVSRAIRVYERLKLEVDALKSLLGYGDSLFGSDVKSQPDGLEFVRNCPLLIKSLEPCADVEVVSGHPIVQNVFRQLFLHLTIPLLERQYLTIAERNYHHRSYFARLRHFDAQNAICEYRKCLGDNVSMEERDNDPPTVRATPSITSYLSTRGTTVEEDKAPLQPPNVLGHVQEHFNRVVSSFNNYYRIAGAGNSGMVSRVFLLPHLETLLLQPQLTVASKGRIYQTMACIYGSVLRDNNVGEKLLDEAYAVYQDRYGENTWQIAGVLQQQAELSSSEQSLILLERALKIYEMTNKVNKTNKHSFEYAKTLIALGVTYGSLGESVRSKDMLEKGLMELQNTAPDNPHAKENKWFAGEISSAVTSLGHAYLSLGNISQGRKLLELALIGHQNVHGNNHSEVVRVLTTLSIAHAMQGNSHESKRLRTEAGKIKKQLDIMSPVFVA